ncbi:MAG: hypothetical protein HKN92_03000 [Chitinophagales bacterium]|nr:hypothetical protein [Chitinophagales bacterium]
MWIKKQEYKWFFRSPKFKWLTLSTVFVALLFFIYIGSVYTVSRYKHHLILMTVSSHLKTPINYLKSLTVVPDRMEIDIRFEDVETLRKQILESRSTKGFMETFQSDTSYVPISITYQGKRYGAEARLKGNWWDARITPKWSLRINLKGNDRIKGVKRFSVHSPVVKGFMTEWLFQKLAAIEGVLSLEYSFLNLVINGEHGIYAFEEQINLEFPERNKLPQSVIVKFDEYWMYRAMLKDYENVSDEDMELLYTVSPIEAVQMKKVLEDPLLKEQFNVASNLLNGFRNKELKASEVFILKDVASLFAIADLFGHPHNVEMRNMRFYFDPVLNKLKPIAYDQHRIIRKSTELIGEKWGSSDYRQSSNWKSTFFEDEAFYNEYLVALERISNDEFMINLRNTLDKNFRYNQNIVYKDNPNVSIPYWKFIELNAATIKRKLNPKKLCDAYIGGNELQVLNIHSLPIIVNELRFGQKKEIQLDQLILPTTPFKKPSVYTYTLSIDSVMYDSVAVSCSLAGLKQIESARQYSGMFLRAGYSEGSFDEVLFDIDENKSVVSLKSNILTIDKHIVIPQKYQLKIKAGQSIKFTKDGQLTSKGSTIILGTKDNPIYISGSGRNAMVFEGDENVFEHVIFEHMGIPPNEGKLRGAITVYHATATFVQCRFIENYSEDALHIISSDFQLDSCHFENVRSDGLDSDFSRGEVRNSTFNKIGNDGIDFSGSNAVASNVTVSYFGDKGLSIGEKSKVLIENCTISHGRTAVASKDSSSVNIRSIQIENCEYEFAIYQKKAIYGPASITTGGGIIYDPKKVMIEEGSKLQIGDQVIQGDKKGLRSIFN